MLKGLGIDARAALVNTQLRRGLVDRQPSPGQFDHVLVQARIAGRSYWLDPTRDEQTATLENVYQPDFDLALLVDPATATLTSMKAQAERLSRRQLSAEFDATAGLDKPVRFTLTSVVDGARAEDLRTMLDQTSFDAMQKQYLNFYARYYPNIAIAEPMTVSNDASANQVTTVERYVISDFAVWSEADQRFTADIAVPDIDDLLRGPASSVRQSPLLLAHPIDAVQTTEIKLAESWPSKQESFTVDDPAFQYEGRITPKPLGFVMTDSYRSKMDEIPPADVARYVANLNRARDLTGYRMSWTKPSPTGGEALAAMNPWLALVAMVSALLWIALAVRVWRYDPPTAMVGDSRLQGLGGWLLLVGLGEIITPFALVFLLYSAAPAFTTSAWMALASSTSPTYNPAWAPWALFELVSLTGMLVFSIMMILLFFGRRSSFPRLYIIMLVVFLIYTCVDLLGTHLLDSSEPGAVGGAISTAVQTALWTAYMLQSKRVASTFIERLAPRADSATPARWWQPRYTSPASLASTDSRS